MGARQLPARHEHEQMMLEVVVHPVGRQEGAREGAGGDRARVPQRIVVVGHQRVLGRCRAAGRPADTRWPAGAATGAGRAASARGRRARRAGPRCSPAVRATAATRRRPSRQTGQPSTRAHAVTPARSSRTPRHRTATRHREGREQREIGIVAGACAGDGDDAAGGTPGARPRWDWRRATARSGC